MRWDFGEFCYLQTSLKILPLVFLFEVERFYQEGFDVPLVSGCAGWMICKLINEPHNQTEHDLFVGEVLATWADDRIFENSYWKFDEAPDELKTLYYVAGTQFYQIDKGLTVEKGVETP